MTQANQRIGPMQIAIILLTLFTAAVHLYLGVSTVDPMFLANGLGYLALVAALYLPIPQLAARHALIRWVLVAFATVTIIGWVFIGDKTLAIGYPTKLAEIALITLLVLEARQK
ncbi:MAG: hypothetical protein WCF84_12370 [Anaerolineae bacterium]